VFGLPVLRSLKILEMQMKPGVLKNALIDVVEDIESGNTLSEAFGKQLTEILTRILKNRLDPQMVLAKLEEVDQVPPEGVARTVDENQRHLIIQSLIGKPVEQIAITAHLMVEDSAEYAKALATPLMMVGWQIEGNQVRRAAPKPGALRWVLRHYRTR